MRARIRAAWRAFMERPKSVEQQLLDIQRECNAKAALCIFGPSPTGGFTGLIHGESRHVVGALLMIVKQIPSGGLIMTTGVAPNQRPQEENLQ